MPITKPSKRERTLFLATAIIAIIAILYNFVAEPFVKDWKTLNARIRAKRTLLSKNTRLLTRYQILEEEYVKYPALTEVIESEEEKLAMALGEIEKISKKSSSRILNIKPHIPKKVGNYMEISFDVTAEGAPAEISRFLYEIETSEESLRIRHFTLTARSGASGKLKAVFLISKIIAI